MKKHSEFHIFAYGAQGQGVSGGDRIFIEIARRLTQYPKLHVWVSNEGRDMCTRMNLKSKNIVYHVATLSRFRSFGSIAFNLSLVFVGIKNGLFQPIHNNITMYSASEFWMDSIPTLLWKIRNKSSNWIASWYQTAPSPLKGFSLTASSRNRLASLPYWFFQKTTKPYISRFADIIAVNNNSEKDQFPTHKKRKKIFIMYGAVDTELTQKFETKVGKQKKEYDAVFQGRFHPQKGVLELLDIWKKVTKSNSGAQLVMIGDGPLMTEVKTGIEERGLQNNVLLLGYVFDGKLKYQTFMQSKLVVHPAFYDSGGMASAEAMAFGLPCVGFDLPSYKDYYPQGMIKVPIGDTSAFARAIVKLLSDQVYAHKYALEAKRMVMTSWSWNTRVQDFETFITS